MISEATRTFIMHSFQLPAVVHGRITIVFSPLIALIQDQMIQCRKRNILCESLNSKLTKTERQHIIDVFVILVSPMVDNA
jgi:superfamily II DNA helicase RecQ